jgi:anaerobic magnesium-protoporphyrin IX monomethyl ester cyclase
LLELAVDALHSVDSCGGPGDGACVRLMLLNRRITEPKFLLAFPPLQYAADEMIRPDGTLALPYLDAALTRAGFHSEILDMSIGTPADPLASTFHRRVALSDTMVRIGMSAERILAEVREFDVVALTSIFTQQTSRCFEVSQLIKEAYPDKLVIAGGVNARSLRDAFFAHGFDVIFLSEAEMSIVQFAHFLRSGKPALSDIPGIAFRYGNDTVVTRPPVVADDLDAYPMPSWAKLPNERYWEISRIWGGKEGWMDGEAQPRYAAMFTSRGCPFRCTYCHISKERGSESGDIANLRLHSLPRIEEELDTLKRLGVNYVYINDDSFLAKKERVFAVLAALRRYAFKLADVNGVNIIHLFTRQGRKLVVDEALLEALSAAGFRKVSLPFESGTQRLIDQYSAGKWDLERCDVVDLVAKLDRVGLVADGNFMIGYPDETPEELTNTFLLARRLMDAGLVGCQFFMVQPFPGTRLFDECIANGQLSPSWHWDELGWSKGSPFTRPRIDNDMLKYCWSLVWRLLNKDSRVREFTQQLQ